jgi:hypothetical protein
MKSDQDDISFHSTEIKHTVFEINLTVMGERNWWNRAELLSYRVWEQGTKHKEK